MPRDYAEQRIQAAQVKWVRTVAPQCLVFAVINDTLRTKAEAAKAKWVGQLKGMTDYVVIAPGGRAHLIEVKTLFGRLSSDQQAVRNWCLQNDVPWALCRSIEDVRAAFVCWGIETREAAVAGAAE